MVETSSGSESGPGTSSANSKPVAANPPSAQFSNGLLVASGTAFLTGIFGSLWYQDRVAAGTPAVSNLQSLHDFKKSEALVKEGRLLGVKAFAVATTVCLSGAVLIVGATRWALDVETIPEFSAKMRVLFPKQKTKFVDAVVSADRSVFGDSPEQESLKTSPSSEAASSDGEKDLDHEEDNNLLRRIERELRRLETEEKLSEQSGQSGP
ncbi:hypothetical protein BGX26_006709 [Mortierella sp. AD094]|nr:hypothetical protein BGX26_006709 [Mortierella sp. AD094]